jgi:hypothetical protein
LNAGGAKIQNAADRSQTSLLPRFVADWTGSLFDDVICRTSHVILKKYLAAIQHSGAFRRTYGTSTVSKGVSALSRSTKSTDLC